MRGSKLLMIAVALLGTTALSGCEMIQGYFRAKEAAVKWEGEVKEITYQKLDKDGKVFDIELHSRIDAPPAKVWEAMKKPERLAEVSDMYKRSELLSESGNKKVLEIHVLTLDNLQQFKVEITFDDATKTMKIKSLESTLAEIDGTYELKPSPDGQKTLYIYKAKQTDKVVLPVSVDVQRSAIKESFVNQVNAIKQQIGVS